jgi:4'-phosphopantetheinyl transferase
MTNTVHIFYLKQIERIPEVVFEQFCAQLPEYFLRDIRAYKHWESAQPSLLGKMVLQYGLQKLALHYTLSDIKITEKERPYLLGTIDFNISHSGKYVVCAIGELSHIGIDIEKHRTLKMNVADRYFTKEECHVIDSAADPQATFFDFWAVKESAIKCDGRGVEVLSKTYVDKVQQDGLQAAGSVYCDGKALHFQQITIEKGYSCSVCSPESFQIRFSQVQLTDLR